MNSHFQSSDTTCTSSGCVRVASGRPGSSCVRADPGHAAQKNDRHGRNRPDDELDAAGERPVRQVAGPGVRGAEPPGEGDRGDDRRHDDGQHDGQRVDQQRAIGRTDGSLRIEHASLAGGQGERQRDAPSGRASRKAVSKRWVEARHDGRMMRAFCGGCQWADDAGPGQPLPAQIVVEERQRARPRELGRGLVVARRRVVVKAVVGVRDT